MRQSNFKPNNFFLNNGAYYLGFCAQNYPLIFFKFKSFLTSRSPAFWNSKLWKTTKKASVKPWEDLLYFQQFVQSFVYAPNQWLSTLKTEDYEMTFLDLRWCNVSIS